MARRILNRKDLRADFDAAERRKPGGEELDENQDEAEDDLDSDEKAETDAEAGDRENGDAEERPAKKKAAPRATRTKPRSRAPKVARMKVVWGVFNNSNQRVATFDYPKRQDADELANKLSADKKAAHFVQPIKEPFEEKKDG
ncbi:MAG TPA: hypothetical protein VG013_22485 [Gemmataceae bacterium]|jgi:hypothetical protein|nr:hypothetical protein [Gemmataceae bacterium]